MTLKQIIDDKFYILLQCMDPTLDLLGRLRSVPFVKEQMSFINQQTDDDEKNNAILNTLCEVPDDIQETVMSGFISALRSSGQEHVANIFRRESDKVPMSDTHRRTLTVNFKQLCKFVDPENGLLDTLISMEVISVTSARSIRSIPSTYNGNAQKLIEILMRKSDDTFHDFITALTCTGQSHVAYILTGEGNSRHLKEEHRAKLLTSKRYFLVNTIDSKSSGLVTALMSKGVFSDYDEQRVTGLQPGTNYDRNELILNLIARKSQSDFFNFISALNDTDQTHVSVALIGADVVAKIKTVYESGSDVRHILDVDAELVEYVRKMFRTNSDVVKRLNELLSHNGVSVSDVKEGCLEVTFTCENVASLLNLRRLRCSGELEQILCETFCFQFANKGLKSLKLTITNEQFEQCASWVPMTAEHRKSLLSSEASLLNEIKMSADFLDRLRLCKRRRQAIEQAATREQQVKTLLDVVSRRPDSAFDELLSALRDTHQNKAVVIIGGNDQPASELKKETAKTTKVSPFRQLERRSLDETTGDELINSLHLTKAAVSGDFGSRIYAASRDVAQMVLQQRSLLTERSMSDIGGTYTPHRQLWDARHHSGELASFQHS